MDTNTLQIRSFPIEVNRRLKIMAVERGVSFRELVINILSQYAKAGQATAATRKGD